ncbi:MAG: helix-turn-helix domain-containing protein, partial [Candidatus Nitrosopolaris sp.]
MVFPYFRFTLQKLGTLSSLSNTSIKLEPTQYMLLYHFAENPATSAYDIRKKRENDYDGTKKIIKRLKDLGLIEEVTKKPNIHNAHYYKLSAHGVYHIIANKDRLEYDILNSLIKNYEDHPLFQYFLYPCIKQETLLKLRDSAISSHTFSYLHDCCQS